jgi:hypothetical protein
MHQTYPSIIKVITPWLLLLGFMMLSQPQKLPVLLLIVPFVLLFVALMSTWAVVVPALHRLLGKRGYAGARRLRVTVCGSAVLLIILQSLGQLTLRDMITIGAIAVLGYLYVGRSRSERQGK